MIVPTSISERRFARVEMFDRFDVHDTNLAKNFGTALTAPFNINCNVTLLLDTTRPPFPEPIWMETFYEYIGITYSTGRLDLLLRNFVRIPSRELLTPDTGNQASSYKKYEHEPQESR